MNVYLDKKISVKFRKIFGFEERIPVGGSLRFEFALATAATAERSFLNSEETNEAVHRFRHRLTHI